MWLSDLRDWFKDVHMRLPGPREAAFQEGGISVERDRIPITNTAERTGLGPGQGSHPRVLQRRERKPRDGE